MSHRQHSTAPPTINVGELASGDVLMCYSAMMDGAHVEMAGYSHVAICVSAGLVLNADVGGVATCTAVDLLKSYDHLAVLRSRDLWDDGALQRLREFAAQTVGKPFNKTGMLRLPARQQVHADTVMQELDAYFANRTSNSPIPSSYFCSQLVVAAFIAAGVIGESASIVLKPEVTTPRGICFDAIYGRFIGYLTRPGCKVSESDRFRSQWV